MAGGRRDAIRVELAARLVDFWLRRLLLRLRQLHLLTLRLLAVAPALFGFGFGFGFGFQRLTFEP